MSFTYIFIMGCIMRNKSGVVDLISEVLGFPRRYDNSIEEVEYCCPRCDNGRNKFNLVLNLYKGVFHCWACEYKGRVDKIVKMYGDANQAKRLQKIIAGLNKSSFENEGVDDEALSLDEFRSLRSAWNDSLHYRAAMKYLKKRGITQDIIDKWDICYAESGKYAARIIIPSKSINGKVEYFIARDIYGTSKLKYKNPRSRKQSVIFGERFIDWTKPVILTEGVFDAIVLYNAVPILGTKIVGNDKLIKKIMENKTPIILGFDQDQVGMRERIGVAKFLEKLGSKLYIISDNEYNDLSEAFEKRGKYYIMELIKGAEPFDELEMKVRLL